MEGAEACTSDVLFSDVVSGLERLMDASGTRIVEAGDVTTSAAAALLVAPSLSRERCLEISGAGGSMSSMLAEELEALWPESGFSSEVRIARRAFINRLGTRLGVICG